MTDIYSTPSSALDVILKLQHSKIIKISRVGYFYDKNLDDIISRLGSTSTFRSLGGALYLHLSNGLNFSVGEIQQDNSVNIQLLSDDWIKSKLEEDHNSNFKFKKIDYDDKEYGDISFGKYLNQEIINVDVVKQNSGELKHENCSNEVGIIINFKDINTGLAIGANLAPYGGFGNVMLIPESEIDKNWLVDYELVRVF